MENYHEYIKKNPPEKEPLPPGFDADAASMIDDLLGKSYDDLTDEEKARVDAFKSAVDSARRSDLQ